MYLPLPTQTTYLLDLYFELGQIDNEQIKKDTQLSDDVIVENIPKSMRPRASALLNRLKARPGIISYDETGQVQIDGVTIPQSNIRFGIRRYEGEKKFQPCWLRTIFLGFNQEQNGQRTCEKR